MNEHDSDLSRREFLSTSVKVVAGAAAMTGLPNEPAAAEISNSDHGASSVDAQQTASIATIIDPAPLISNGVDVAGALTEDFLNTFSEAHFKHGSDIYKGSVTITEFDSNLKISYEFMNRIKFELNPIRASLFEALWLSHLRAKGAPGLTAVNIVPPNLVIRSEKIKFVFTVYKGRTATEDFSVTFEWDIEARCAVHLVDAGGNAKAVRLEPLKIVFSKPATTIASEIAAAVKRVGQDRHVSPTKSVGKFGNPRDPEWCTKVEKLILFLVNQVLATSMSNFVREWNLPRAIELIKGVSITPTYLDIVAKALIVGGQVQYALPRVSVHSERITGFLEEFNDQFSREMSGLTEEAMEKWSPDQSSSFQFLRQKEQQIKAELSEVQALAALSYPENLQILSNSKLFDALAKAYLKDDHHADYEKGLDFLVKAAAGWWERVDGALGRVVPGGIEVGANVSVGGYASACIPNPDPKHWGQWLCVGLCIDLRPKPNFSMAAFPSFPADGIYVRLNLLTEKIEVNFCGRVPDWANKIIGWISGVLTQPLLAVIRAFIALFNIKIVDYPSHFPGTPLQIDAFRFNTRPTNVGPYLVFTADPKFK